MATESDTPFTVVRCSQCGVGLKVQAAAPTAVCPKCGTVWRRRALMRAVMRLAGVPSLVPPQRETSPRPERKIAPTVAATKPKPAPVTFGEFYRQHLDATGASSAWMWGVIGCFLFAPVLSLLKPWHGATGLWWFGLIVAGGVSACFVIYRLARVMDYFLLRHREIPATPGGLFARLGYAGRAFAFPLIPLLLAETVSPPRGLFATAIPACRAPQDRLLAGISGKWPSIAGVVGAQADANESEPSADDSTDLVQLAQQSGSERATFSSEDKEEQSEKLKPTPAAPRSSQSSNDKKAGLQEVIAEGVGATPQEALKDAFRSAVRQVVGAVVDAETLVKNDEIVEDQVLTYSDGFIKTYDKVPGTEKQDRGLHRLKIKASVERRSVVAKLKAANVTVREVDGKGLFAEAVTQLEAEKDAAALLRKALAGFPENCLTATVIGKPEIAEKNADKAVLQIRVQVEPDLKAYKAFSERLVTLLDKFAREKGESFAVFEHRKLDGGFDYLIQKGEEGDHGAHTSSLGMLFVKAIGVDSLSKYVDPVTKLSDPVTMPVPVIVATQRTETADRLEFRCFLIDKSLKTAINAAAFRSGTGKLVLLDGDDNTVAVDRFPLYERLPRNSLEIHTGNLAVAARGGELIGPDRGGVINEASKSDAGPVIIAPVFFRCHENNNGLVQKPTLTFIRAIALSLDELKSVQTLKCEVSFRE